MKRAAVTISVTLVLLLGVAVSCGRLAYRVPGSPVPTRFPASWPATYSFLFTDATSVQFLSWTQTTTGALNGTTAELQDLEPGSPSFLASTTGWTGTRTGDTVTILLPGATVIATVSGVDLFRPVTDPQTGQVIDQEWVPGTARDYNALVTAFRAYIQIGQDILGIEFDVQTAVSFPSPALPGQVQSYLADLQSRLATLRSLELPHIPGLRTPWAIPAARITAAIVAADAFLATPTVPA